jgi:hypothetical protein
MTPKHRKEEKDAQSRREREFEIRSDGAEEAFESFREALRAVTTGGKLDAAEAVTAFDELIELARALGREEERKREKLYGALIAYGSNKTVKLGPTTSRDAAASLARSWMDSHAGVTSRGESVKSVSVDLVDEDGEPES